MTVESSSDKVLKALNWQPPPKKVSQAAFDAAILDNIDALDMTPQEAVESVEEEFKMQGMDLSDVIRTPEGGDISKHPMHLAIQKVVACVKEGNAGARLEAAVDSAIALLMSQDPDTWQQHLAVAYQGHSLQELLVLTAPPCTSASTALQVVKLCSLVLRTASIRDSFSARGTMHGVSCHGPGVAVSLLERHADDADVVEAVANMCKAAATGSEDSKWQLMESTFPSKALAIVAGNAPGAPLRVTVALLDALKALMSNDDTRPPTSKAFTHARMLALEHGAVPVFVGAFQRAVDEPEALDGIVASLQQLCANDEICKQVCDAKGVQMVLGAMQRHFQHAGMVASTCSLLRQLAKSDDVKILFMAIDGLDVLVNIFTEHKQAPKVCAQAMGLLATVLLRQPEHCEAAFAKPRLMDEVVDTMRAHQASPPVMRQACQMIRNLVVRNPDLRKPVLQLCVEPVLRAAKQLRECDDVAVAALRDLGLDDYNK